MAKLPRRLILLVASGFLQIPEGIERRKESGDKSRALQGRPKNGSSAESVGKFKPLTLKNTEISCQSDRSGTWFSCIGKTATEKRNPYSGFKYGFLFSVAAFPRDTNMSIVSITVSTDWESREGTHEFFGGAKKIGAPAAGYVPRASARYLGASVGIRLGSPRMASVRLRSARRQVRW